MAESILHFGAITLRINGSGLCRMTLIGLDDTRTKTLSPLTMATSPGREPTTLTNFNSQRARVRILTNEFDDYMRVNRVVIWIKERATSFPKGGK